MKKTAALLLTMVLLLLCVPLRAEAASASLTGPGTVRAGDTITVKFAAGGGISGGNGTLSYDSSLLTLQSCSGSLSSPWVVEFAGSSFVFYDNSMTSPITGTKTIFTAKFKVSASAAPGTEISVSVKGVTLSDGSSDSSIGSRTYATTLAEPLSGNAMLKSLTVSNATISPAFDPDTTSYTASVPYSTSSLKVDAQAEHSGAKVSITNTALTANATTDVKITVTAENGATRVYHIRTRRAQDPNYVPSGVNTLAVLQAEGLTLSPAFDPQRQSYAVYVPYETESVSVSADVTDSRSSVKLPRIEGIPAGESTHEIVVTAENGQKRTYTLTVFRAQPFDTEIVVTEPTEPPTEPAEVTQPATEPTVPATTEPAVEEPAAPAAFPWQWVGACLVCFALGFAVKAMVPGKKQ